MSGGYGLGAIQRVARKVSSERLVFAFTCFIIDI
jgi:hypothetical protein